MSPSLRATITLGVLVRRNELTAAIEAAVYEASQDKN
jgi:hypothetical protein